jgi:hypothetical protein
LAANLALEAAMGVFRDKTGVEWHVDVTVSSLRRVRDGGLGVDLLDISDQEKGVATQLVDDPILLVGVLYEICRPEVASRGLTATQFGELFDGSAIDGAVDALLESLTGFIPRHRGRVMAEARVHYTRMENLGLITEIRRELQAHGLSSFASQESPELTPAI